MVFEMNDNVIGKAEGDCCLCRCWHSLFHTNICIKAFPNGGLRCVAWSWTLVILFLAVSIRIPAMCCDCISALVYFCCSNLVHYKYIYNI